MNAAVNDIRRHWGVVLLFVLALGYNVWGVTYHFGMGFLAGHEFRQSQTALISRYIDRENNFGLLYETPILGKPWVSILMEVPIYEWSVVGLSRLTGWEHVISARLISVGCFYAMLGAVWLLLGRLGVARVRRLLFLALILAAPVYIFYSRAFLIDAMALMAGVWWLYAFVRVMQERDWRWLAVAVVAGSVSALVKGAVYAVWLVPGAAYGAWVLWREWRAQLGWKRLLQTVGWGLGTVVVAVGLLRAWVAYTDPIKAAHASAWIFTSANLSLGNWGMFSAEALLSGKVWGFLTRCWEQAIMSRWLLGAVLVLGLCLPRARKPVLGIGGMFFVAQFMMPYAFAYQDYYFYMIAVFALVAAGYVVTALWETKVWWSGWVLVAVLLTAQVRAYFADYYQQQSIYHEGGYPFTAVIRELTPKNSVIVVAGADWAAMTPLYAERRALMVRNGLEYDREYLKRAFADLKGEVVSAIVLWNQTRENRELIEAAARHYGIDGRQPTFSWEDKADIYINPLYARAVQYRLLQDKRYAGIILPDSAREITKDTKLLKITPEEAEVMFSQMTPLPYQVSFDLGLDWMDVGDRKVLSAHPDTDLWLYPPAGATQVEWTFGIFDSAYTKEGDKSDGVIFIVVGETPDGVARIIHERLLDPLNNEADRGDQHVVIPYTALPGETLRFSTRGNKTPAYDWAYIYEIKVQ
ncbi:MAG: glycosyltransferase family 39 protein [Opitutaceae bacterium]|nr:glycosyltransferase family 39 protein [Opitutaceae bacterium]